MNTRPLLFALFLSSLASPLTTNAQNTQVTVTGVVPAKSDSRSATQKARPEALELAKKNAWSVLKKRAEFQDIVFNFAREQDQEMVARLDDLCTPPVDIDQSYDKKLGLLTFRFRFECDQQALVRDAGRLNRTLAAASGGGASAAPRAKLSGFFIALKDDRVEEFDATVKQSSQDSQSLSVRQQSSATATAESRVKGAIKTKESEDATYGESGGRVSEGVDRSAAVNGRVQASSSAATTAASDTSSTAMREVQSSGSRVRQSAKISRVVVSAQELQRALVPILQRDRFTFIPYGTVGARCGSIPFEQIQDEIRNLPVDFPLALRDVTRDKVLQSMSGCPALPGIQYYVEGYAKIGAPGVDPATGQVRVSVSVSQVIFDASTGAEVSSTPEQRVYGVGEDETVATTNALQKAAESVGQVTVSNLTGMGL